MSTLNGFHEDRPPPFIAPLFIGIILFALFCSFVVILYVGLIQGAWND